MVDLKKEGFTKEDLAEALAEAPAKMTFASTEAARSYHNMVLINGDSEYGQSIIGFAETWARLMEGEILRRQEQELDVEAIIQYSYLADTAYGMSMASYGFARNLLIVHWKWGRNLMTRNQRKKYGRRPNMSRFYTTDDMVREKLSRRQ